MTKNEYLIDLGTDLRRHRVADADDIVSEYEQHFNFKLSDGFTEEEIAARLEKPAQVVAHYTAMNAGNPAAGGVLLKIAMGALAFLESLAYAMFFAFIMVTAAATIAFLVLGAALILNINIGGIIPETPYLCALVFGICILALAALFGVITRMCFVFFRQIIRASIRWHDIVIGKTALPPLSWTPQLGAAANRRNRNVLLWALIIFGISLILGYIISALTAGAFEFWHAWGWFGG